VERTESHIDIAGIAFDRNSGALTTGTKRAKLEPRAADVLALLYEERGRVVLRQRLLDTCWDHDGGTDEGLTQAVAQIRRSLDALGAPRETVTTYPKRGYGLTAAGAAVAPRPNRNLAAWAVVGLLIAATIAVLVFAPHWPRHLVRHALGLRPIHAQHR